MAGDQRYVLADTDEETERARLRHLESWLDPVTVRHLEASGVGEGWRCCEVGAGGGSVARWLGERVGASGSVLATDIDIRHLAGLPANVEVRRHDLLADELEAGAFDLVHCRALLSNLADSRGGLCRLLEAVAAGGWLVVEESDFGVFTMAGTPDAGRATKAVHDAFSRLGAAGVGNSFFGREVPGLMHALDLEGFGVDAVTGIGIPGDAVYEIIRLAWPELRRGAAVVGVGESDLVCVDTALESTSSLMVVETLFAAWGRKPG